MSLARSLGQSNLLLSRQQPHLADALQEQLQAVRRPLRLQIPRSLAAGPLRGRTLDDQARSGRIDLLDQLDLEAIKDAMQLLDVGALELELADGGRDLGVGQHAGLKPTGDQALDIFKLPKIRC